MFCAIFSNGKWWQSWNAKLQKTKMASYKKHSGRKLDQFQPMVLEILSFLCLCYLSNSPGGYLDRSIFFLILKQLNEKIIDTNLVKTHKLLLRYCHFHVLRYF